MNSYILEVIFNDPTKDIIVADLAEAIKTCYELRDNPFFPKENIIGIRQNKPDGNIVARFHRDSFIWIDNYIRKEFNRTKQAVDEELQRLHWEKKALCSISASGFIPNDIFRTPIGHLTYTQGRHGIEFSWHNLVVTDLY